MKASQDMLQQQVTKYSDQMQRLGELVVLIEIAEITMVVLTAFFVLAIYPFL